jgi:glycosyltransferase involved in cell wall biosynthesis
MAAGRRPPVAVIAWGPHAGRSAEMAAALGGESRCFFDFGIVDRRVVPLRYILSALRTVGFLARRRPASVVATNPPVVPGLIAWLYGRMTGGRVILDSHPSSFDPHAHRELACQLPVHRWLTRRVAATLVTVPELERTVRDWGGTPIVFHEVDPGWRLARAQRPGPRPRILSINSFNVDEPVPALLAAARLLEDCDLTIAGDVRRCPAELQAGAPANVRFAGYLRGDRYRAAFEEADVVVALSTRPQSVGRVLHEAVWARRPIVMSDWPATRDLFSEAVHVGNDPASIAAGVRDALARHGDLVDAADLALARQRARADGQLAALSAALGLPAVERDRATPAPEPARTVA